MNSVEKIKNVILSNCVDEAERKIGVEIEGLYYTAIIFELSGPR